MTTEVFRFIAVRPTERRDFKIFIHGVIPVIGMIVLVPALLAGAGIPAFSFISALPAPISYAGPIVGVWMVLGIVFLFYKRAKSPGAIGAIADVFTESPTAAVAVVD